MRFRRLSLPELEPLEQEFKHFLGVNGLPAEEWALIKQTNHARTEQLLDDFSDMILERSLKNIKTVEFRTPDKWYVFRYDDLEATCILLESDAPDSVNLLETPLETLFATAEIIEHLSVAKLKKSHKKNREDELFALLNNGGTIAKNELFEQFSLLDPTR